MTRVFYSFYFLKLRIMKDIINKLIFDKKESLVLNLLSRVNLEEAVTTIPTSVTFPLLFLAGQCLAGLGREN